MNKICDLHTHSTFSDGTYTPSEIIDESIKIGLSAVALCDHNTIEGLPQFLEASVNKPIEAIAGAEFSVDYLGKELHLLGLYIPKKYFSQVSDLMTSVNKRKEESNLELITNLKNIGINLDYNKIKNSTETGKVNRAHIAAELTRLGYTTSIKHAFETVLSTSFGCYKEPKRLTVWEMLDFINSINAVPVLAHPFLNLEESELVDFLPKAKSNGLIGMECQYSLYDNEKTNKSISLANAYGLKTSGGSDFHGTIKPDIQLGLGKGNLSIPYDWAVSLKPQQ